MESAACWPGLNGRRVRSVYLITYSKANIEIIASNESSAVVVLDSFQNADPTSKTKVYNGCAVRNIIRMVKFTITWLLNLIEIGDG